LAFISTYYRRCTVKTTSKKEKTVSPANGAHVLERNVLSIALYGTETWTLQKVDQIT
jgi:hypothetical protein